MRPWDGGSWVIVIGGSLLDASGREKVHLDVEHLLDEREKLRKR
jgi:hypothetical protein